MWRTPLEFQLLELRAWQTQCVAATTVSLTATENAEKSFQYKDTTWRFSLRAEQDTSEA
jgi:hypothetical protein